MASKDIVTFDATQLPSVFDSVEEAKFKEVSEAIEDRDGEYDDALDEEINDWDDNPFNDSGPLF